MNYRIVTMKEIMKGNKRMCLLPLRALKRCFQCDLYDTCESKKRNFKFERLQRDLAKEKNRNIEEVTSIKNKMENL